MYDPDLSIEEPRIIVSPASKDDPDLNTCPDGFDPAVWAVWDEGTRRGYLLAMKLSEQRKNGEI